MASDTYQCFHICLAGPVVSNDWSLIQRLKTQNQITLVERMRLLSRNAVLKKVDLLVLDCSENRELGIELLSFLKKYYPSVNIVLVDGGFTQKQIAAAFQNGARDYFADPYDTNLLIERLDALGKEARTRTLDWNAA